MNRGDEWREKGTCFSWAPRGGDAGEVQIFHVELGEADAPPLVLVHGFPTSSVDWFEVAEQLSARALLNPLRETGSMYRASGTYTTSCDENDTCQPCTCAPHTRMGGLSGRAAWCK
jgi:hypothetical protein